MKQIGKFQTFLYCPETEGRSEVQECKIPNHLTFFRDLGNCRMWRGSQDAVFVLVRVGINPLLAVLFQIPEHKLNAMFTLERPEAYDVK